MNTQAESSNASQFLPLKRRRGRPRKDHSLRRVAIAPLSMGYGVRENRTRQAEKNGDTEGGMVGQAVTGVIEAAFDAGYLLTVRIGNSNTSLKGVVFKPGEFVPLTAGNDIAPHVPMIKRNEVYFPLVSQVQSNHESRERNESDGALHFNQGLRALPLPSSMVVSKSKLSSPTIGPSSHLGGRGNVVPVVLQPVSALNGSPSDNQALPDSSVSKDKDAVTAEPLAMLMPEGSASSSRFWAARDQHQPLQQQASDQAPPGFSQNTNSSSNESSGVVRDGEEEIEGLKQTSVPAPVDMTGMQEGTSDDSKLAAPTSQMDLDQEISDMQSPFAPMAMRNYGTGRMSELLMAVQENFKPVGGPGVNYQELQNPN